jgi:hypothetical protein
VQRGGWRGEQLWLAALKLPWSWLEIHWISVEFKISSSETTSTVLLEISRTKNLLKTSRTTNLLKLSRTTDLLDISRTKNLLKTSRTTNLHKSSTTTDLLKVSRTTNILEIGRITDRFKQIRTAVLLNKLNHGSSYPDLLDSRLHLKPKLLSPSPILTQPSVLQSLLFVDLISPHCSSILLSELHAYRRLKEMLIISQKTFVLSF